jgi:sugar lactone lactonase YvrE
MPYGEGRERGVLYRLDGSEAVPVVTGVGLSNGLGWSPDGRHVGTVRMPVSQPTSCCFAGDVLVITTAAHGLDEEAVAAQPHAGALFAVRPGVSGPGATLWTG